MVKYDTMASTNTKRSLTVGNTGSPNSSNVHMASTNTKRSLTVGNTSSPNSSSVHLSMSKRNSQVPGSLNASRMRMNSTSRVGLASKSRFDKNALSKKESKNTFRVLAADGQDVTPRSLISSALKETTNNMVERTDSRSVINFNDSRAFGLPAEFQSTFGASYAAGASMVQGSYATGLNKSILMMSSMVSSRASLDSITSEISNPSTPSKCPSNTVRITYTPSDEKEILTPADLNTMINVTLTETDTITLFEMQSSSVSTSDEDAELVKERNARYVKLCAIKEGNDTYRERGMQTFNDDSKTKEMQTVVVEHTDVGCLVTSYDLYDTYNADEESTDGEDEDDEIDAITPKARRGTSDSADFEDDVSTQSKSTSRSYAMASQTPAASIDHGTSGSNLITPQGSGSPPPKPVTKFGDKSNEAQMEELAKKDSFMEKLFIMERTVVQNNYHPKQCLYRGLPELRLYGLGEDGDRIYDACRQMGVISKIGPNISRLWAYECSSTRGLSVTCMAWNSANTDILAIGYSQFAFAAIGKGLVCLWSIKNPEHPERMFLPSCAVTSLDFSVNRPNLLAVGLYDGTILLYNIKNSHDKLVLDNGESLGKHGAPVWQLRWVKKSDDKGEVLVSSSGDGRVTQWTIIKGFEFTDLMKVKRSTKQVNPKRTGGGAAKKSDAFISRYTPAMCFDFHPSDGNIYLVGTEDHCVHRCSCSYNEQFLETYLGHKGPVYRIFWSPFDSDLFLTCSTDWSVKLWHVNRTEPVLSFQASTKAVIDIDWSPVSSTMFVSISENQIEIWDLTYSILDPLIINTPVNKVALTSVKFALNAKVLLVGDCEGNTSVFQLAEMNMLSDNQHEKLAKVLRSTLPKTG